MSIAWISTALRSTHHNTGNLRAGKALRGDDPCAHARNTICSTRCARASPLTRLRRVHRRSDRCAVFRSHVIGATAAPKKPEHREYEVHTEYGDGGIAHRAYAWNGLAAERDIWHRRSDHQ